jgi:molybdate transport system ATP-binding protein
MSLSVRIRLSYGNFSLDVDHRFAASGLTALFGQSGSGKSTLLRVIAGLETSGQANIAMGSEVWQHERSRVAPERRGVGYVFQDARLFPHLSVRGNLGYASRRAKRFAGPSMEEVVEALDLSPLLERRPSGLSGGERQRVAIGRALLAAPRILLMDEPLASLDAQRKTEIMPYIERLRDEAKVPIIYVSHSVAEVARLATDVVLLAAGKIVLSGPTSDILQRLDLLPQDEVGEGGAVLDMVVDEHDETYGMTVLRSAAGEIRVPRIHAPEGARVRLRIRARDVMVATEKPRGLSALNVLAGRIAGMNSGGGPVVDVRIDCSGETVVARLTRQSTHTLGLTLGQDVFAVVKTVSFDRGSATRGMQPAG